MFADFETMRAVCLVAVGVAVLAWLGDRRRMRRSNLDAVGFMPWTPVFFASLMIACIALSFAAKDWFAG